MTGVTAYAKNLSQWGRTASRPVRIWLTRITGLPFSRIGMACTGEKVGALAPGAVVESQPSLDSSAVLTTSSRKLQLGCGPNAMAGWINVDNVPYQGVDAVLDVTSGLPFSDLQYVFAEHFIEHLPYQKALALLRECRRVLAAEGVLRLSTPNLDWVWKTHYGLDEPESEAVKHCFELNRAFHGWGHHFLYNERALRATLLAAGFRDVVRCEYGASAHPELRRLERHELSKSLGDLSSILIVEASGRGAELPRSLQLPMTEYLRDVAVK
jgi:predicted SAM-dependent methyltransferase